MKISNAARLIFWVTAIFALGILVRAESGEKRANAPNRKSAPPLRIVDQNGRPAVNGVPIGLRARFSMSRWGRAAMCLCRTQSTSRWATPCGGPGPRAAIVSPVAIPSCTSDGQFCSPNNTNCSTCVTSNQGFVYEFTFTQAGSFSYFCCVHCAIGMTGVVNVSGGGSCSWAAGPDLPGAAAAAGIRFGWSLFPG